MITRFEQLVKSKSSPAHRYIYFNFHEKCHNKNFASLESILKIGSIANFLGSYVR